MRVTSATIAIKYDNFVMENLNLLCPPFSVALLPMIMWYSFHLSMTITLIAVENESSSPAARHRMPVI